MHSFFRPAVFFLTLTMSLNAFSERKAADRITQDIDERETRQLQGNVHPQLQHAQDQGRMDGGLPMEGVSLVFKRTAQQEAEIEKLLAEQQDPASPNFHKWLTPEQYGDRFGLSKADLAKVVAWLQSQGFTVNRVARARTQVWFSGSVAQVEQVFRTEMHRYTVKGEPHFANGVEPAIPAALADVVLGVHNLTDFRPRVRAHVRRMSEAGVKANLTSSLSGSHFVVPDDFATIYDVKALYTAGFDGTGQKIAVMGQSEVNNTDIDAFRSAAGLPARTATNFVRTLVPGTGTSTVVSGDVDESSLDLEWAEGVAKGATEVFVYTGNNPSFNVFDAFTYAIDNNLAPVISMSYGNCEQNLPSTFLQSVQQKTQQANLQGQTIAAASGDFGAADCGNPGSNSSTLPATTGLAVDIPGALPYVTSVGGTTFTGDATAAVSGSCAAATTYWGPSCSLTSGGSALQYIPETGWNDTTASSSLSSGGGGASTLFSKPSWQTGTGVPDDGKRDVPDVALAASPDHDGYLLCSGGSCVNGFRDNTANTAFNVAGGTSFGAPTFAGIVAILNQKTGSSQGNVNPTLYALATANVGAFHDITTGDNIVPCGAGTPDCPTSAKYGFSAGAGYDQVTGLGTIDAAKLVNNWSSGNSTTADFSFFGKTVSISAPGGSGTSTIVVDGRNGYSGSVSFTCTAPSSALITCSVTGSPVVLSSSTKSGTVTLSVGTSAHAALDPSRTPLWFVTSGGVLAGVFMLAIPAGRRRWSVALSLIAMALIAAAVGCGGSSSSSSSKSAGTPVGNYNVKVTGSDGTTSHTTSVAVAVQ